MQIKLIYVEQKLIIATLRGFLTCVAMHALRNQLFVIFCGDLTGCHVCEALDRRLRLWSFWWSSPSSGFWLVFCCQLFKPLAKPLGECSAETMFVRSAWHSTTSNQLVERCPLRAFSFLGREQHLPTRRPNYPNSSRSGQRAPLLRKQYRHQWRLGSLRK